MVEGGQTALQQCGSRIDCEDNECLAQQPNRYVLAIMTAFSPGSMLTLTTRDGDSNDKHQLTQI